jgi:MFS family permease
MQQLGVNALFALSAAFSFGAVITGLLIKLPKMEQPAIRTKDFSVKSFIETSAVPISIVGAFFAILYSSLLSFVSVYAKEIHLADVSSLFFVVYAVLLVASRPFTGRWFDRYGANKIIFPSILLFALGILLLSRTQGAGSFLSSAGLIGLGWGTIFPLLQTIAIQDALQSRKAVATATFLSIYDTGMGLGSFIVGVIAANIGFRSLYFIGSFYVLLGVVLYYILFARKQVMFKKQQTRTQKPSLAKRDISV